MSGEAIDLSDQMASIGRGARLLISPSRARSCLSKHRANRRSSLPAICARRLCASPRPHLAAGFSSIWGAGAGSCASGSACPRKANRTPLHYPHKSLGRRASLRREWLPPPWSGYVLLVPRCRGRRCWPDAPGCVHDAPLGWLGSRRWRTNGAVGRSLADGAPQTRSETLVLLA